MLLIKPPPRMLHLLFDSYQKVKLHDHAHAHAYVQRFFFVFFYLSIALPLFFLFNSFVCLLPAITFKLDHASIFVRLLLSFTTDNGFLIWQQWMNEPNIKLSWAVLLLLLLSWCLEPPKKEEEIQQIKKVSKPTKRQTINTIQHWVQEENTPLSAM